MFSKNKEVNMRHLENWLGDEKIEHLRRCMKGWYGRPICLIDVPGSVWIHADGTFGGKLNAGYFASAVDYLYDYTKKLLDAPYQPSTLHAGFTSISDALSRASQGFSQRRNFSKTGPTGVTSATSSLWRVGTQPSAGSAGGAAPGGTVHVGSNAGALSLANPAAGTNRLVGADVSAGTFGNSLLLYDRLFSVAKTMNSTATEAVTGTPSRYQSATDTAEDFAGDNFLFVEVGGTALAATAHNWTTCLYTDEAGATGRTLPSITGNSGAIVDRLDHPISQWFAPLAAGDTGIKALTQMQCSAAVATGAINFVIGHPIGFMAFPLANMTFPFDWLTNRDQAPRIFDDACLAFLEPSKPSATAATYNGRIVTTSTSA